MAARYECGNQPVMDILVQRLNPTAELPARSHPGDAGFDLRALGHWQLAPGERAAIPTGISIAIPRGYVGLVHPRSGLALKHGVTVANAPGTIDAAFRGEIKVILINHGSEPFLIENGDRIAQIVFVALAPLSLSEVNELPGTHRGSNGFGSSGLH